MKTKFNFQTVIGLGKYVFALAFIGFILSMSSQNTLPTFLNVSYIDLPERGCEEIISENVGTQFVKLGDLGTFYQVDNRSTVDIYLQSNFYAEYSDNTAVEFQLRVDDAPTYEGQASFLLGKNMNDKSVPQSIHGLFPAIGQGEHTISIWARTIVNTAPIVILDAGCYESKTDFLIVKEYKIGF